MANAFKFEKDDTSYNEIFKASEGFTQKSKNTNYTTRNVLKDFDNKIINKVIDGLSEMDKKAEIHKDKKGNIIYDKESKDTEIVKFEEDIDTYMAREVLPHVPDAKAFFEGKSETATWDEDNGEKTIKIGAEIPFTRYFYEYKEPTPSEELLAKFQELEKQVREKINELF